MEYKNVYVAVCDILGFKELITNNDFDTTKRIFERFVSNLELAVTGGKALFIEGKVVADPNEIRLNFNLFSDTVVIWTVDDSVPSFFDLLKGTANLFISSMKFGLPLRGAISHGELLVNPYQIKSDFNNFENVIFGKALIKAYKLEQDQLWSGCIIDPEFAKSSDNAIKLIFDEKLNNEFYNFYNVPLKSSGCRKYLTLNWVNWSETDEFSEEIIQSSFEAHNKSIADKCVKVKIENTIEYYRYSREIMKHFTR